MPTGISAMRPGPVSQRSWWVAYAVAVVVSLAALVLREILDPVLQRAIFMPFMLALVLSGWYGGFGPGLLATALSVLTMAWRMPWSTPLNPPTTATDTLVLGLFGFTGLCISLLTGQLHYTWRRAEAEATARQQAEVAAQAQRERFEVILTSIGDAVIVTNSQGRVTFLNAVAAALIGWPEAEALGQDIAEVFHIVNEHTRQAVELPTARVIREGAVVGLANHTILLRRDGRAVPVDDSAAPIHDAQGSILGVVLVFRDVTARRQAEQALRDSQQQLAGILASAMDAIITLDAEQRILLFNAAAEQMFHVTAAEIQGQSIDRFIPERFRQAHREHIRRFGQTQVTRRAMGALGTLTGLRADGEEFPIEASISQLIVGEQKLYTVILRDITARQQAEEALQEAYVRLEQRVEERTAALQREMAERQRLEQEAQGAEHFALLGRMAAGVSHEIRNPLGAIFLHVELLEAEWRAPSPDSVQHITEALAEIKINLGRLEDLVQDYLSLVRVSTIQRDVQPLGPTMQAWADEWQPMAKTRGVTLRCETLEALGEVAFHHNTLQRALLNLVQNALDAMPSGGTLTLTGHCTATQVQLSVQDTGSGISPARWQQIFEPLYTTKPGGTGLGLYIVQEIVTAHEGQVTVQSQLGQGTTFTITLPRASAAPASPLPPGEG